MDVGDALCPVCLQVVQDAVLTACGHSFCASCIYRHLGGAADCPTCRQPLTPELVIPNTLLTKLLRELAEHRSAAVLQQGTPETTAELDARIAQLLQCKRALEQDAEEASLEVLLEFLRQSKLRKVQALNDVKQELAAVDADIRTVGQWCTELAHAQAAQHAPGGGAPGPPADTAALSDADAAAAAKRARVLSQFDDLQGAYLRAHAQHAAVGAREGCTPLDEFASVLAEFARYGHLRVVAELPHGDALHGASILSSIEFDLDNEFFATAGVAKRIRLFDFRRVLGAGGGAAPALELLARSKVSSLSFSKGVKSHVACSDYAGAVSVFDTASGQCVAAYEEHEKRVWSVDFCTAAPTLLASGGDDGHVKVFCARSRRATLDLDLRANVCCVRYDPGCAHTLAVGSADHGVHLYDSRQPRAPLHVFAGHQKAVSYVAFLPGGELVSASTDSSLRVWDVGRRCGVRALRGHANDKNFVGLSARDDFVACGSEDNTVFVYHRAATRPVARHSFALPPPVSESDADDAQLQPPQPFVSAVCWKGDAPVLLAANSDGVLRVLALAC